jgi:hypothetical protein
MGGVLMASRFDVAGGPQISGIPVPGVDRGALGDLAQTGEALLRSKQADRETEEQAREIERKQAEATEAANGQVANLRAVGEARRRVEELRTDGALTLEERDRAVSAIGEQLRSDMLAAYGSPRVRERFMPDVERDVQQLAIEQDAWTRGQRAKIQGAAADELGGASAAAVRAAPTPATFERERERRRAYLESQDLTPAERVAFESALDGQALSAMVLGLTDKGAYEDARAMARSGGFAALLGPERAESYLNRIDAEERAQLAAAKAEQAAASKAAEEAADAVIATIDEGGIVSDRDIGTAVAAAQAAGVDPAKIVRLQGAYADQAVNKAFGPAADPDGRKVRAEISRLNGLAAERALSSEENMTYQRLLKIQGMRHQSDADGLRPMFGKSVAGDLQVLGELDKRPVGDRFATANQVRPGLGYYALLSGTNRQLAVEGAWEVRADPDLTKAEGPNKGKRIVVPEEFRKFLGPLASFGFMGGASLGGRTDVAEAVYAKLLKENGKRGWDQALFERAANIAMGAEQRGGVWYGGIGTVNDKRVELPDWGTARQIETMIARDAYGDARYRDGRAARKEDVLRNFTPILVSGGARGEAAAYVLVDASGAELQHKDGGRYVLRLRQRP